MILNLKHRGRVCSNFDTRLASPKQVSKSNVSSSLNFCWSKGKNMAYASNAVCHHFDWREEASDMEHLWNISRMCQPKLAAESCVPFDMCSIFLESEKTKYIQILHIYVNPEKSYKFLQIHQKSSTFGLLESWVCLCLRRFISQRSFVCSLLFVISAMQRWLHRFIWELCPPHLPQHGRVTRPSTSLGHHTLVAWHSQILP